MQWMYLPCSSAFKPWLGSTFTLRREASISFTSFSVCDINNIIAPEMSGEQYSSPSPTTGNSIFFSPAKTNSNGTTLAGPILSLKKFCESLPATASKPSGLNMIRWKRKAYSPTDKERRWKLENDAVKHRLAHENINQRKGQSRAQARTEPAQPSSYQQDFQKIRRKELTTALISKEQQQVFANIKEDSMRQQFKRNHANVWNFIVKKKKQSLVQPQVHPNLKTIRMRQKDYERQKLQKSRLNQKLKSYIKKWHPNPGKSLHQSYSTPIKKAFSEKKSRLIP